MNSRALIMTAIAASALFTGSANASVESFIDRGVNWLKDNAPATTVINFEKSRFSTMGCKHREYALVISQPLNDRISLEAGLTHVKGQMDWGTYSQAVRSLQYSVMPRLQLDDDVSIGAGIIKQSAPNFRTNQGADVTLPGHTQMIVNTRFNGASEGHSIELAYTSTRWEATAAEGTWFERGVADNRLMLTYDVRF